MLFAFAMLLAVLAYVYWQLSATDTDIRPQDDYTADGTWNGPTQTVHYIQPHRGEPLPRS